MVAARKPESGQQPSSSAWKTNLQLSLNHPLTGRRCPIPFVDEGFRPLCPFGCLSDDSVSGMCPGPQWILMVPKM